MVNVLILSSNKSSGCRNGAGVFLFCEASGSTAFTRRCRPPAGRAHNTLPYKPQQCHVGFASARTPAKIALDPAALHRALLNIFTNAAEALDTLPPEATKRVRITAVHDRGVVASGSFISENGPGLQPEERERMFEPTFPARKGARGWGWPLSNPSSPITVAPSGCSGTGGGTSIVLEFPVMRPSGFRLRSMGNSNS